MKTWALVAVAAMGLTACQNDFEEQVEAKDSVVVTFVADSADTRTSVDTSGEEPKFAWGDDETFAVLEQTDALAEATSVTFEKVDGKANITAEFPVNEGKDEYSYVTVYPASGYVSASGIAEATLTLPAEQTMVEDSYDPNADLMVSEVKTTNAQPTEAQMVGFHRIAAVVEMTINNLAIGAGEQIEKVEFIADGKDLAGTITADLNVEEGAAPTLTVAEGEGVSSVSVATTSNKVYFTVLPTTLEAEDTYSVVVVTNKNLYIKQGAIPADKRLAFESGKVTRFGVNMSGVNPSDKWVLVRDASTLKQGDVVTIAAKNYNYVIGKPSASVYPLASQTEAIKAGNYLYHNPAEATVDHMLQSYTLMQRDENRNAFDFYNGVDFEGDTSVGFAWANGSNNTPKLQAFCDKNTLFDVSIADGVATITASEISGSYKYWRYYHANSATSRKFDLTSSAITNDANKILLYKLEGAVGTIPTVAANVTVPDSDEFVVIAEEGAAEATAIDAVVFNYVGDWAISVSDNAEWLEVNYADGKLYYTAEQNTEVKRDAVATITASLEGEESLNWSFNLVQKGAPQEISIAEFITKGQDVNATYKLTGKLVTIPASANNAFVLEDENGKQAQIKYLKLSDGKTQALNNVDLKVGDVVTVTTVVTSSTKGTGGNSTYPSIYKGHYGINASAGLAADYTGGAVTIEVETYSNGTITLPESVVVATMPESDYAELTYTGGDTATVTFTSENTTSDAREATVTFTYGATSVEVTVEQGVNPANKLGYELVTDASTLNVGDEVIIVAKNADKAIACPTSTSGTTYPAIEIEKTGNVIYDAEEAGALVFTLVDDGDEQTATMALQFTYSNGSTRYLSATSSTGLRSRDSINDSARFTIVIEEAVAAIASPNKQVHYNSNTGANFSANTSTNSNVTKEANFVCIYKKQTK